MFNNKTLIVIGAGASKEAGLPTGYELKQRIADLLDIRFRFSPLLRIDAPEPTGDDLIKDALNEYSRKHNPHSPGDINPYLNAAWRIRDAMPQASSIDTFIDNHHGDKEIELCGKLAIARSILEAEKKSLMYFDKTKDSANINFSSLVGTWFESFWHLLIENCSRDDLPKRLSSLALIVFNYDRCIEHFLYHSLQNYYGLSEIEAAKIIRNIEIYHPYGKVGHLRWQQDDNSIGFGEEPHPIGLLTLADQIKTFSEGTDTNSSEVVTIRQKLCEANIIIFLGFAFHQMNLDLLKPTIISSHDSRSVAYYATSKGISLSNCDIIKSKLNSLNGKDAKLIEIKNNLTCSQFFHEYWMSLSLS